MAVFDSNKNSPPAEPKCEYRPHLSKHCSLGTVGCPHHPTPEPAESEGKALRSCPICSNVMSVVFFPHTDLVPAGYHITGHDVDCFLNYSLGNIYDTADEAATAWNWRPPTAPPAESVEDALECLEMFGIGLAAEAKSTTTKSLRARQCEIRSKAIFTVLDAFKTLESEREQYATKQIERQTPAIISDHNAELLKENLRLDSENERLVSELETKTRALEQIAAPSHLSVQSQIIRHHRDIAQAALKSE